MSRAWPAGRLQILSRSVAGLWLAGILAGAVILLTPETAKTPLVAFADWTMEGRFFENDRPSARDVSGEIASDPRARFFRSWSPDTGATQGRMATLPFAAARVIAVPVQSFADEPDIAVYLERVDTGERLAVASGDMPSQWTERTLVVPASWVHRAIRLVAETSSPRAEVAIGTPFRSSWLSWLKESAFAVTAIHLFAFVLLLGPGGATVLWLRQHTARGPGPIWIIPLTLTFGYASFFLFYYLHDAATPAVLGITLLSVAYLTWQHQRLRQLLQEDLVGWPLALCLVLSLYYVLNLFAVDSGLASWSANFRFEPPIWSSDNQLPQWVAEGIYRQVRPEAILGGGWRASDRPPLLAGFMLLARPAMEAVLAVGSNRRLAYLFFQILGIVASTFWVVPAYLTATRFVDGRLQARLLLLIGAVSGFVIFNESFVSPKLLAAGLALLACEYAGLWRSSRSPWTVAQAAGAALAAALAYLSHGGVVFGLLVCGGFAAIRRWRDVPWRQTVVGGVIALGLLWPWTIWQQRENPPGNALAKYAFAGTFGFDEPQKGVWETVRERYGRLTLEEWTQSRLDRVEVVVGADLETSDQRIAATRDVSLPGRLRGYEGMLPVAAIGVANLGWVALLASIWLPPRDPVRQRRRRAAISLGLAGIALTVLTTWSGGFVYEQSYLSVMLIWLALMSEAITFGRTFRLLTLGLALLYFVVVWQFAPLVGKPVRFDFLAASLLALGVAGRSYKARTSLPRHSLEADAQP